MVQFRAMADDGQAVQDVLAAVIPWLRACPDLIISDTRELGHRGGGSRVVFEVLLARPADAPVRATAERVTPRSPARSPGRRGAGGRRRALDP
ncbi:hypothetical protein ACFWYW_46775 [Nonomuraea sp. NPDC059023]|uniref:hypothetical protein n=1 Tax=unclassified Nonomuraea TaxID=2593643 RepID=UPI00369A57CF